MYADTFTPKLQRAIREAGLPFAAKYAPADDDSEDDNIEFYRDGKDTGLHIQVGYGYAILGQISKKPKWTLAHLQVFERPTEQHVLADVMKVLHERAK